MPTDAPASTTSPVVGRGDTAWMFASTLPVTLMLASGLALFDGGLVRGKNVLSV